LASLDGRDRSDSSPEIGTCRELVREPVCDPLAGAPSFCVKRRLSSFLLCHNYSLTVEQMGHYRLINGWFQDGQQALDRIERIYREDRPEIADELYISLIVLCLDKILRDTRPKTVTGAIKRPVKKKPTKSTKKKQAAPVKGLKLASGQAIAFGSVVPKN
jgi:hypothetical protein